ncbi:hypothetical protein WOLCODRAFT_149595 [Wolfiporia cocos MD-104 SS10]|uniref:Uncharacterized protein n=1 Tax=Wolfiporia cocos (strain MD-104) TaxID=742152 RepID=A0A2H3J8W3_WOLCO|nr:hypothetical protein WOLCODRAFT_149595 [Wolfiporia cocos MD-104 SS10]
MHAHPADLMHDPPVGPAYIRPQICEPLCAHNAREQLRKVAPSHVAAGAAKAGLRYSFDDFLSITLSSTGLRRRLVVLAPNRHLRYAQEFSDASCALDDQYLWLKQVVELAQHTIITFD